MKVFNVGFKGVHCGLRHCVHAVGGVGWGCIRAEHGELVAVHRPQIRACPLPGLVDTTRAELRGSGEGVGSMRGLVLPVTGGVCLSRADGLIAPMVAPAC
ncbi:hypothetical protein TIFTF001_030038 [Ficus carica]|uniref:Uncharacterized protein n=1 Tax=Ficus carica TaxID=3494 RepID=A0AA88J4B5_FICCA|nr:hypothetical protein TIFTF001_030038 [Ficus carica]